jgi:predicted nucleic acid-binding protein
MPTIYVADANFLLRLVQPSSPLHSAAAQAARRIVLLGDKIVIFPQCLYEVYAVATRPSTARDGLGLSPADGKALLESFQKAYSLCAELPIYLEWERLVSSYGTSGATSHDTRYVALMLSHELTHILTFNGKDFVRYTPEGIVVVDPSDI